MNKDIFGLSDGDFVRHVVSKRKGIITRIHDDYHGTRYEVRFVDPTTKEWCSYRELELLCPVG
jgi:hypothetical protein